MKRSHLVKVYPTQEAARLAVADMFGWTDVRLEPHEHGWFITACSSLPAPACRKRMVLMDDGYARVHPYDHTEVTQ